MSETWLKKMRLREGLSQNEVAERLKISQSQYSRYEVDPDEVPYRLLKVLGMLLHFEPGEIDEGDPIRHEIKPGDPYSRQREHLKLLKRFLFSDPEAIASSRKAKSMGVVVPTINELQRLIHKYEHKPNIIFVGRYDTGKSYLANHMLGGDFLPSGHQPTTKLLNIIRHISEKPMWQTKPVVFLQKDFWRNGKDYQFDISYLSEEARYTNSEEATLHSLHEHGVFLHGRRRKFYEQTERLEFHTAVIYIDSPLLLSCNIIDTPGFSDNDVLGLEEERFKPIQDLMDILIYTSGVNGFMDSRDQAYLKYLISLSSQGFEKFSQHPSLDNIFVVCTLASPDIIKDQELKEVLENGAYRLYDQIQESVFKDLESKTGQKYSTSDLEQRFFTFWGEKITRHHKLYDQLSNYLGQVIPDASLLNFESDLNDLKKLASLSISQGIDYYQNVKNNTEKATIKYNAIKGYEPERKKELNKEINSLIVLIRSLKSSGKESFRLKANILLQVSEIKKYISEEYDKDQKKANGNAPLLIFTKLEIIAKKTLVEDYEQKLCPSLKCFTVLYDSLSLSIELNKSQSSISVFNSKRFFVDALVENTARITAISFGIFGPIGLVIGLGIAIFGWIFNRQSWQERLSKQIKDSFEENNYILNLENSIEKFWDDVESLFANTVKQAENERDRSVNELKLMISNDSMNTAEKNINTLEILKDFFEQI